MKYIMHHVTHAEYWTPEHKHVHYTNGIILMLVWFAITYWRERKHKGLTGCSSWSGRGSWFRSHRDLCPPRQRFPYRLCNIPTRIAAHIVLRSGDRLWESSGEQSRCAPDHQYLEIIIFIISYVVIYPNKCIHDIYSIINIQVIHCSRFVPHMAWLMASGRWSQREIWQKQNWMPQQFFLLHVFL